MKTLGIIQILLIINSTTLANDDADPTLTNPNTTPGGRIANRLAEPAPVTVSKCCPEKQSLDVSNPRDPICVDVNKEVSPFVQIKGLDLSRIHGRNVDIQLVKNEQQPFAMPPCFSDFEVHRIEVHESEKVRDTWITVKGELVTSRYEAEFEHGEFCVDVDVKNSGVVAVMCDACKKGIPCINMCCPHGHAFQDNPDYDYDLESPFSICKKKEGGLSYDPVLWDHSDKVFLDNWKKNKHFIIVGAKMIPEDKVVSHSFECPPVPNNVLDEGLTMAPTDLGTFRILINGKLEGRDILNMGTNAKETKRWNTESFCVVFASPPDYDYDAENETSSNVSGTSDGTDPYVDFDFTYMTCHDEGLSWCERFTSTFHTILLSLSTVFLIITLMVYVCEDTLRRTNPLFSKITIGFISNLIICFIVLIDNYLQSLEEERRETVPCILSGYMLLYSFLAFFFWINTMSFNIWLKFTRMSMQSPSKEEEKKKFWKYFVYAQGMPLLIVVITAIVDATGKGETEQNRAEDLIHYPNMGIYSCFLGAVKTSSHQNYFGRPEFIYFQLFIMIIQIMNITFLGITISSLYKGWQNQANLHKITGKDQENDLKAKFQKLKEQLTVVVRLFVIMGVPWILELITSIIATEHGFDESCLLRVCLDTANLLAGVLIFLVIVAKKPVLLSLQAKASGLKSSIYPSMASSSAGNTKATDIELNSVSAPESQK